MSGLPPIVAEALGNTEVSFTVELASGRKVHMQAMRDPMAKGWEAFEKSGILQGSIAGVVTEKAKLNWALAMPKLADQKRLADAWAQAVGLGEEGFSVLIKATNRLDLVEVDLQRFYHVDVAEWVRPNGELSTRRVVGLLQGIRHRPDSLFWADSGEFDPLTKAEILLAQIAGQLAQKAHPFLTGKRDRAARREQEEKMARIMARKKQQ